MTPVDEQQLELDYPGAAPAIDGPDAEPLHVDYTKYEPGVALSTDVMLSACRKRGATGQRRDFLKHTRWVHSVDIVAGKVKAKGMCNVLRGGA